ncbi:bifunctional adenosylcobinamide kinase/adenosylcobinamide-phosphate guanylyltransferase [Mangrovibacillus sp. Mu-81]|uniref:bifunctional adenosylcobinamide kinase/adenosylcobinamide-phosphate guanylyltransferase n=1 Tax=Mangrovibacillus sp. Mu-81 TaxID=3121478 RepID=UPI002FE43C3E
MTAEIIFICGGVRSGKSSFAESRAEFYQSAVPEATLHYIACSRALDDEMSQRIRRHQADREKSEHSWMTWECPVNIGSLSENFFSKDIVLLDCVTTLLTNEMFLAESINEQKLTEKIVEDVKKLSKNAGKLILVSNDVFCEPVAADDFVKSFTKTLGMAHQKLVEIATEAYSVKNGIPVLKKGRGLPAE